MPTIATYHGTCVDCGELIVPGQQIEHDDTEDGWRHVRCNARPGRVECVCERCMLVHAGECF